MPNVGDILARTSYKRILLHRVFSTVYHDCEKTELLPFDKLTQE